MSAFITKDYKPTWMHDSPDYIPSSTGTIHENKDYTPLKKEIKKYEPPGKYTSIFKTNLQEAMEDVETLINSHQFYRAISIMSNLCMIFEKHKLHNFLTTALRLKDTLLVISTNTDPTFFEEHKQLVLKDMETLWLWFKYL